MPDMSMLDKILREAYFPMIEEQLLEKSILFGDGWPRRWILFPRIHKLEMKARWMKRDIKEWWECRPKFLGGNGMPDAY